MLSLAVLGAVALPAGLATADAAPPRKTNDVSKQKNLYMIGYSHLDTQWRWTYLDSIREYLPNTLHENFALFEKYPSYVFNFTGSRRYRMMKDYYPADYARMKDYVKKGRWYPNGSSVEETDVNVPSPESLIRNTLYGNRYFKKEFDVVPSDFILPDCFGFPASLPSVLSHLGGDGIHYPETDLGFPRAHSVYRGGLGRRGWKIRHRCPGPGFLQQSYPPRYQPERRIFAPDQQGW